jgi:hypothetical protein
MSSEFDIKIVKHPYLTWKESCPHCDTENHTTPPDREAMKFIT